MISTENRKSPAVIIHSTLVNDVVHTISHDSHAAAVLLLGGIHTCYLSVYLPNISRSEDDFNNALLGIQRCMDNICVLFPHVVWIIGGDFNVELCADDCFVRPSSSGRAVTGRSHALIAWASRFDIVFASTWMQCSAQPPGWTHKHFSLGTRNTLDYVACAKTVVSRVTDFTCDYGIAWASDHVPISFVYMQATVPKARKKSFKIRTSFKQDVWQTFWNNSVLTDSIEHCSNLCRQAAKSSAVPMVKNMVGPGRPIALQNAFAALAEETDADKRHEIGRACHRLHRGWVGIRNAKQFRLNGLKAPREDNKHAGEHFENQWGCDF